MGSLTVYARRTDGSWAPYQPQRGENLELVFDELSLPEGASYKIDNGTDLWVTVSVELQAGSWHVFSLAPGRSIQIP